VTTEINLLRWTKIMTLWKMRTVFDKLTVAYAVYYSTTEHLAFDEINALSFSNSIYEINANSLG
jgi:hypothetical protein